MTRQLNSEAPVAEPKQRTSASVVEQGNRRIRVLTVDDEGLLRDLGYEDVQLQIIERRRSHNRAATELANRR